MVDEKKQVELEVTANTDQAEKRLTKIANQAATLGQTDKKYAEIAEKHQQQTEKFDKKVNDPRKQKKKERGSKTILDHEEKKLSLLKKQNKELEKYARTQSRIAGTPGGGGGGAPGGGGAAGGADKSGPSFASGLAGFAGGAALTIAGMAVGAVAKQISAGFGEYVEFAKSQIGLAGMGATEGSLDTLRNVSADKYGYMATETMQQAGAVGRATGNYGAVSQAQELTRGTSMNMEESIGLMQTMTQAGTQFGGDKGNKKGIRELQKAVALGFNAGMDDARLPEYLRGVQKVVQAQGGRRGGDIDFSEYGQVFSTLSKFGGSGWQGDRGASMFSKLNEGIVNPGGGEAGEALMLQAMGFGVPGGDSTYYEAKKQQQKGATPENVKAMIGMVGAQQGAGEEQYMALGKMLGMDDNYEAVERMVAVVEQNLGTTMTDEKLQALIDETGSAEDRAAKELEGIGKVTMESVSLQNRLVDIGRDSYASIYEMQLSINKAVDQLLPAGNAVLDTISNTTKFIANLMGGNVDIDSSKGVQRQTSWFSFGEDSQVVGDIPHGQQGQGDPAYVAGHQNMPLEKRKAFIDLYAENPQSSTHSTMEGKTGLRDIYDEMVAAKKFGPTPEEQAEIMKDLIGPNGEFTARLAQLENAAVSTAQSAAKATEALAEAKRQGNSHAATTAPPPGEVFLESVPGPGTVY